jgi:hypothetical protein
MSNPQPLASSRVLSALASDCKAIADWNHGNADTVIQLYFSVECINDMGVFAPFVAWRNPT